MKKITALLLVLAIMLSLGVCGASGQKAEEITVTDMIGREVAVTPGSYRSVVCIGAGL